MVRGRSEVERDGFNGVEMRRRGKGLYGICSIHCELFVGHSFIMIHESRIQRCRYCNDQPKG